MRRVAFTIALATSLCIASAAHAGSVMAKYVSTSNGTTIKVDLRGKPTVIRLYGVVTPDPNDPEPSLSRIGREAKAFMHEYLKTNWVYLEFPVNDPKPDKDGVIDAYVYVHRGNVAYFVNEQLVSQGLAIVNRKQKTPYHDKLVETESTAKSSSRGMWGSFKDGGGKDIAAGSQRTTYVGEVQAQDGYVTRWIMSWWY